MWREPKDLVKHIVAEENPKKIQQCAMNGSFIYKFSNRVLE